MPQNGNFLEQLRRDGVVRSAAARLTPLPGGVSCDICLVEDGDERFVVKRALPKLKVAADWSADVDRNRYEWMFIRYVAEFLPQAVPELRHCDAEGGYFAMEYLGNGFATWKELLLSGGCSAIHAAGAAHILAEIHKHSAGDGRAAEMFATTRNFLQLRIDPYLRETAARHPALRSLFEEEAVRLEHARECLVHGDFSPKNILVGGTRTVLLDCEVAWYGDPAFDLAFLLNHLFLKALLHAPQGSGLRVLIREFPAHYLSERPSPGLETRTGRLLLMLMLARVDGKSPVEYLDEPRRKFVRDFVARELPAGNFLPADIADAWFRKMEELGK